MSTTLPGFVAEKVVPSTDEAEPLEAQYISGCCSISGGDSKIKIDRNSRLPNFENPDSTACQFLQAMPPISPQRQVSFHYTLIILSACLPRLENQGRAASHHGIFLKLRAAHSGGFDSLLIECSQYTMAGLTSWWVAPAQRHNYSRSAPREKSVHNKCFGPLSAAFTM